MMICSSTKWPINTIPRVVLDKEAFTLSEPKAKFGDWFRQKKRHYSTGKFYKPVHKFLLGVYSLTHFLFYPAFYCVTILFRLALGLLGVSRKIDIAGAYLLQSHGKTR